MVQVIALFILLATFFSCSGMKHTPLPNTSPNTKNSALSVIQPCLENDTNCRCAVEVNNIIDGVAYNRAYLEANGGGSALNTLTSSGSENIPVTCTSGMYLLNNSNARSWFLDYFRVQKSHQAGFGGGELFSAAYFQQTAGFILAVHNHAIQRSDTEMEAASSEWLRAYWSFLALAASSAKPERYTHTLLSGAGIFEAPGRGYGVTIVGTRSYSNSNRGSGWHYVFLSAALDHPTRDFSWNLDASAGAYGGIRAFLRKAGYSIHDGQINLRQFSLPARSVGLTDELRASLQAFIASNGVSNLGTVLSLTQPYKLECEITFLRTTNGLINWFGSSEHAAPTCNARKGGTYNAAAYTFSSTTAQILTRVRIDNNPTGGETWKNGQRICANAADMTTECIDMPTGDVIYEVSNGPHGQHCKTGSACGGSTPQPPPPPQNPPTNPPGEDDPPTPPGGGGGSQPPPPTNNEPPIPPPDVTPNCSTNALCLVRGRFKVMASWKNQFNGQSGVASRIVNSDVSGFLHFGDPSNVELIVKILDFGTSVKVFYGQLTNLKFNIKVIDTQTGQIKYYQNTAGDCGGLDGNAFASNSTASKFETIAATSLPSLLQPTVAQTRYPSSQNCTPNSNTLCLQNGRIKITANWRNHYNGATGIGMVKPISSATGGVYFSDLTNLELLVKALDFGDHFLIMYGTLSDLEYTLHVTDTVNGKTKDYFNRGGNYCGGSDTSYFTK